MCFTLFIALSYVALSMAHIVSVTGPTTYNAKAHSKYLLTFLTINGPIAK